MSLSGIGAKALDDHNGALKRSGAITIVPGTPVEKHHQATRKFIVESACEQLAHTAFSWDGTLKEAFRQQLEQILNCRYDSFLCRNVKKQPASRDNGTSPPTASTQTGDKGPPVVLPSVLTGPESQAPLGVRTPFGVVSNMAPSGVLPPFGVSEPTAFGHAKVGIERSPWVASQEQVPLDNSEGQERSRKAAVATASYSREKSRRRELQDQILSNIGQLTGYFAGTIDEVTRQQLRQGHPLSGTAWPTNDPRTKKRHAGACRRGRRWSKRYQPASYWIWSWATWQVYTSGSSWRGAP
jgi:hypothetical protein